MELITWRVFSVIAFVLFVTCIVLMIVFHFTKNRYYHDFHADELVSEQKTPNSYNKIYFTEGTTADFVKKYIISKCGQDQFFVANFCKEYKRIRYYVLQYNTKGKVISVLRIVELKNGLTSKIVALRRNCAYVNVVIGSVDEKQINPDVIKPIARKDIFLHCLFVFGSYFFGLAVFSHILTEIFAGQFIRSYLNGIIHWLVLLALLVFALLMALFRSLGLKKKNTKNVDGGVVNYEFL